MSMNDPKKTSIAEKIGYKKKNVWDNLPSAELKKLMEFGERYKDFLNICKTERESVVHIIQLAEKNGFTDFRSSK